MVYLTREEWEDEQRKYEEFNRRFNAEQEELKRLGVKDPRFDQFDENGVWHSSFSSAQDGDATLFVRLFQIGSHLAELTVELKEKLGGRDLIDQLSRDFGNLREVVGATDVEGSYELCEPVIDRFCESLDSVCAKVPEIERKCTDLQSRLRRFLAPPTIDPTSSREFDEDELF